MAGSNRIYGLQLDPSTHDLVFDRGVLVFETDADRAIRQAVKCDLLFVLGEHFADETIGFPWRAVLGEKPTTAFLRSAFNSAISNAPGIDEVLTLEIGALDAQRRRAVTFKARRMDGALLADTVAVP